MTLDTLLLIAVLWTIVAGCWLLVISRRRKPASDDSPLLFGSLAREPEPPVLTDVVGVHKRWSDV